MKTIHTVIVQFPEISLNTRDAHKLRGYFGEVFKEHSPLLHNHLEDGSLRYRYPLVQYKVVGTTPRTPGGAARNPKIPMLIGMEEGAQLLTELFLKVKEIGIGGKTYPVHSKNIIARNRKIGLADDLHEYRFETLWMALNQNNYKEYNQRNGSEKEEKLKRIGISNILAFYKAFGLILAKEERILIRLNVREKTTKFKDQTMLAFEGGFMTNALLPDWVGIGKAVSRGFGAVRRIGG